MIVEFDIDSDALVSALEAAPGMSVVAEQLDSTDDTSMRAVFWAMGGDFEQFERGLESDPTVEGQTLLADTGDGRLYRGQFPPEAPEIEGYRALVEYDGTLLACENHGSGWFLRTRFPDRDSFTSFRKAVVESGLDISVRAIYEQRESSPERRYGLTDTQRETLVAAEEAGYFAVPRETPLSGVSEQLGISTQSASERLRRGTSSLIRTTLLGNADE